MMNMSLGEMDVLASGAAAVAGGIPGLEEGSKDDDDGDDGAKAGSKAPTDGELTMEEPLESTLA